MPRPLPRRSPEPGAGRIGLIRVQASRSATCWSMPTGMLQSVPLRLVWSRVSGPSGAVLIEREAPGNGGLLTGLISRNAGVRLPLPPPLTGRSTAD